MQTALIILVGFILLWLSHQISSQRKVRFLRFFPVIWFVVSALHLGLGVKAGYPFEEELMIHAWVFGIPVIAWLILTQYLRRKSLKL